MLSIKAIYLNSKLSNVFCDLNFPSKRSLFYHYSDSFHTILWPVYIGLQELFILKN